MSQFNICFLTTREPLSIYTQIEMVILEENTAFYW